MNNIIKKEQSLMLSKDRKIISSFTEIEIYMLNAIQDNDRQKLEKCLEYVGKYNINKEVNTKKITFLHYAASRKDILHVLIKTHNIISSLILYGANCNAIDSYGRTPYELALKLGYKNNAETIDYFYKKIKHYK